MLFQKINLLIRATRGGQFYLDPLQPKSDQKGLAELIPYIKIVDLLVTLLHFNFWF